MEQMLWEMGTSCRERSKGIANVCKGPAEVGHHDNVMKAISKAISFSPATLSSLQIRMRNVSYQFASELACSTQNIKGKERTYLGEQCSQVEPEILILQEKKY